ncbi:MAG: sugar phosphate isomerase/epimerase [Clostridia bacterium]|nr:sugar phosphate isomerase/epimerase [Clostridia bacterium]
MKQKYGLQLYSVRDSMKEDFEGTIKKVAEMGYSYVEFAGFFGRSAEQVKALLEECGLGVCGSHSSVDDLKPEKIDETISYHKALGNKNYILPSIHMSTEAALDESIATINQALPKLKEAGIKLSFHNHAKEFGATKWGTTVYSQLEFRTDISFQLDTYWAWNAKTDPLLVMERLGDRLSTIHLKDGLENGEGRPLGDGEAPVAAVREKAIEMGVIMVVESETLKPSGLAEAQRCIDYLRSLE